MFRTLAAFAAVLGLSLAAAAFDDLEVARNADQARRLYDAAAAEAIAELQDHLAELGADFGEEIEAIRIAAEARGDTAEARRAEAAAAADQQTVRAEPDRSLWTSGEGFFERLHDGHWIEKVPNGDANVFDESTRTAEFVELSRPNAIVRLYADRCEVRLLPARTFREFYKGAWE